MTEVRRLIRRRNRDQIESALIQIHSNLLDDQRNAVAMREKSHFRGPRWAQQASHELVRVLVDVDPVESAFTLGALYLMRQREPYRFPSDASFVFALVRAWRKQTDLSYTSYWDNDAGRVKKKPRELSPRTVVTIAELLIEAYGRFLGLVMLSERREEEARRDIQKNLAVGFAYSTPSEVA